MLAKIRPPTGQGIPLWLRVLISNTEAEIDRGDRKQVRRIAATYQITSEDFTLFVDASSGPITVTLPSAGYVNVKKVDATASAVTVDGAGLLIDGLATKTISTPQQSVTFHGDGVSWGIV